MSDLGDFTEFGGTDETGDDDDDPVSTPTDSPFDPYDIDTVGEDRGLGAVSVSEGLRVAEDGEDTRLRAFVTVGNRERVHLGKYLVVPYPDDEVLFSRITALEYAQEFRSDDATEIHARRAMRRSGVEERDYKFVTTLDPVAVLSGTKDLTRRSTDRVPKPGAIVREAADPRLPPRRRSHGRRPACLPAYACRRRHRVGQDSRRKERSPAVPRPGPDVSDG